MLCQVSYVHHVALLTIEEQTLVSKIEFGIVVVFKSTLLLEYQEAMLTGHKL
jgi:hypothetical protein